MKIAILGTRGVPANYGGFETFAEELSLGLSKNGHSVTVYNRRKFGDSSKKDSEYQGVRIRFIPTIMHKYLETPFHALLSFLDPQLKGQDVVLLCNAANAPFAWILNLRGIPFAINVDGIERNRSKWNAVGRFWYFIGEWCSTKFANKVVADAQVIADYYKERYQVLTEMIAYGACAKSISETPTLSKFSLVPNRYILYVSRLEPENNALGVIQAYKQSKLETPLVIVGDAPYAAEYKNSLYEEAKGANVIFTGYQFGDKYHELMSHCLFYIQATEVGGTHPALIEAMAHGRCILANGTEENIEVLGESGIIYPKNNFNTLAENMKNLALDADRVSQLGRLAKERASHKYTWPKVVEEYQALFESLLG